MASQQVLFAETIAGMRKAFKRKAYESDSDAEIESFTNRGHKLQKRARFARAGQLAPTNGPSAYKQTVDYAGVRRNILHQNPPLIDDEGYEIVSDDDDERVENAEAAAADLNPFSNVRLEHLLAPLTAATDLPHHPTLSKPFNSKTLTELTIQSCQMMRKENLSLWKVRPLWTSFCGDGVWMPCETMVGLNDIDFFSDEHLAQFLQGLSDDDGVLKTLTVPENGTPHSSSNGRGTQKGNGHASGNAIINGDVSMADAASSDASASDHEARDNRQKTSSKVLLNHDSTNRIKHDGGQDKENNPGGDGGCGAEHQQSATNTEPQTEPVASALTPRPESEAFIHPMFLPPARVKLNRDMGLPKNEAEDVRRLLALYVQKQEEVCRGTSRLHLGLLRAQRLRSEVLHWAKAEAHCGENRDMSDGEDWYDKEEWGLTEDLKKGQDEEEEDTTTSGKKTRARRN